MKDKIIMTPHIQLNLNARDWALYDCYDPIEAGAVADTINREIEFQINEAASADKWHECCRILHVFSKYGAADSEGYDVLRNIFKAAYGEEA